MGSMKYVGRDGAVFTSIDEYAKRCNDSEYRYIRRYLNDRMRVEIEWTGHPHSIELFPEHFRQFQFNVYNKRLTDEEGTPFADGPQFTPDPSCYEQFGHEHEAINHYEDFLVRMGTGSEWVSKDGVSQIFFERGNLLAPANPDIPVLAIELGEEEKLEIVGSW
jgi:hypothetical protein